MSSHIHPEAGEKANEKKIENTQHNPVQVPILNTHLTRFTGIQPQLVQHGDAQKTGIPAGVKPLASRPIAPAPGLTVGTATTTAKLLGIQGQHTIMAKAIGLQQAGTTGAQTVAVNLSTQTATSNMTGSQPVHITMSSQSIQSLTLPPGLTGLTQGGTMLQTQPFAQVSVTDEMLAKAHEDKDKSRIIVADQTRTTIPVSSLMRAALPHALQQAPTQVNLTLAPNPGVSQGHASGIPTIISSMPPSHIPRGAAAASALAAPKISTVANPTLRPNQTISTATQIQPPVLQTLSQGVQLRPPLRPSLPASQILTTTVSAHHQAEMQRASAHILTSQSTVQGRPIHTHVQAAKGTMPTAPTIVQGFTAQPQKIVTQAQLLAPATTGTTIVNVSAPKLTGGGQTLSISQSAPRFQKVVSQGNLPQSLPAGAIVVNTTAKPGIPGQRQQKVIMSHVPVTTAAPTTLPVTTVTMPKSGFHGSAVAQAMTAATIVATTATTAGPPPTKKALVKAPAQRHMPPHVALTTTAHIMDHTQLHRDASGQAQAKPVVQPTGQPQAHQPGHIQGNMFTIPTNRPPLGNQAVVSLAMGGQVTTQAESRPQTQEKNIRPGIQQPLPFSLQNCAPLSAANYYQQPYNVIYQPAFTSGSTIRPSIVPGQPANIAATLQATPQGTLSTATAIQPGVRIHPPSLMVNVDPGHAGAITMATQFVAAKTSESPAIVTTVPTPVMQAAAVNHPVNVSQVAISQQSGSVVNQSTNASPRPSILRKRHHDPVVTIAKKNLLSSVNAVDVQSNQDLSQHITPTVSPKPAPPIDPCRENSQSSTDTASSAESTPQSNLEARVKEEPVEAGENAENPTGLTIFSPMNNNIEASPRKKPRKQRLEANHEMQDGCSSDEELDKLAKEDIKKELEWMEEDLKQEEKNKLEVAEDIKEFIDEEGIRWTREKRRPPINLLNHYVCSWKTRNNHFLRYSDVKPKEERRPTVNELANQKGIHQKASGWKMYHLAAQLEELMDLERDVFSSMSVVQESIAPKHIAKNPTMEDDISMVHELTQGNIQRCQLVMDQLEEARVSMVKVLDHKQRIIDIINKHHSKRPVKKKERT